MEKNPEKLPFSFYQQPDVVQIARELLGKVLVTRIESRITAGLIVETEAYRGMTDRASHAFNGRRTRRTEIMYRAGGISYVYLIYGLHVLFNVITNKAGIPDAVLIRAIEPLDGIDLMLQRRKLKELKSQVSNGPAKLTKALGITLEFNGLSLRGDRIWLEDRGFHIEPANVNVGKRIGVDYAREDAHKLWRFRIKNNPFVSQNRS